MIHPDTELRWIGDAIGYGVVATRPIPRGTIIWARDELDQVLTPGRVARLDARYAELIDRYAYRDHDGNWVLCWDLARYVNHSCNANCLGAGYDFEIALRDIAAGEELTDDYASLNLTHSFTCACGRRTCRGTVRPEHFEVYGATWDRRLAKAFRLIKDVPQPLWAFVREKEQVDSVLAGRTRMASSMVHLCPPHVPSPHGASPGGAVHRDSAAARSR